MEFICETCNISFASNKNLVRHRRRCGIVSSRRNEFGCEFCNKSFSRKDALKRHTDTRHAVGGRLSPVNAVFDCGLCSKFFSSIDLLHNHRQHFHRPNKKIVLFNSAHKKACELYRRQLPKRMFLLREVINYLRNDFISFMHRRLRTRGTYKLSFAARLQFCQSAHLHKVIENGKVGERNVEIMYTFMRSETHVITLSTNLSVQYAVMMEHIENNCDDFVNRGSGWIHIDSLFVDIEVGECLRLTGTCTDGLPHSVVRKNSKLAILEGKTSRKRKLVNRARDSTEDEVHMQNVRAQRRRTDMDVFGYHDHGSYGCFYIAIASHFVGDHDAELLQEFIESKMKYTSMYSFPVNKITLFEEKNSHLDLAINVLYKEEDDIFPCYSSVRHTAKNVVNLLLFLKKTNEAIQNMEEGEVGGELHYVRIDDMQQLFADCKSTTTGNTYKNKLFFCYNCFNKFYREDTLKKHVQWCHTKEGQIQIVPEKGEVVQFENRSKTFMNAYTFTFDFETLQCEPKRRCKCLDKNECACKTTVETEMPAFAYSIVVVDRHNKVEEDLSYVGEDADVQFIHAILDLEKRYHKKIKAVEPMVMTESQKKEHARARICHICNQVIFQNKVRDHDHISGKYIGAAHNGCNLRRKESMKLVGFSHNFSGFDSHIIIEALSKKTFSDLHIEAIPLNTEKFKMLKINSIVMLDSVAFLNDSLERLVENLVASNHTFPIMKQCWPEQEERDLLLRKGVYPYEYATSLKKVLTTKKLPAKKHFYSRLKKEHVSDSDYKHAKEVWNYFDCQSLKDYTKLYCRADTFQLAEAVMQLRNTIYNNFKLDMTHYLSMPMITKDIMLKESGCKIELISDIDMLHWIKSNIRGGLSYVNTRFIDVEAERQERVKRGQKPHFSLLYVDANNLYGAAMRFPMPVGDYKWLKKKERESVLKNINTLSTNDTTGYIFEVTLRYPKHLHKKHSSFPLAPHQLEITDEMLSDYAREAKERLTGKRKYRARKLTSTFLARKNYVCHALNLKLYLQLGLQVVKVHKAISFRQERVLKAHVDMCTKSRASAPTMSLKNFWKLLNNSLYGKMIESGANKMDVKINHSRRDAVRRNTDPRYKSHKIIGENLSITFLKRKKNRLNSLWAIGFSILEISKYIMQLLFYKKLHPVFKNKVEVIMSDTDSFIIGVPTASADKAAALLADVMDFSNYDPNHPLYSERVKNKTGYLKNEVPTDEIMRAAAIRAKVYVTETKLKKLSQKCKGVKKNVTKNLDFDTFHELLRQISSKTVEQYSILSKSHRNMLVRQKKTAVTSFDDKRFLLCAIHSVPYGSKLIKKSINMKQCYKCSKKGSIF